MRLRFSSILLFISLTLNADQFAFSFYNDAFVGTDKYFTNAMSFSWIDDSFESDEDVDTRSYDNFTYSIVDALPLVVLDKTKRHNAGISISQIAITPADKNISTPQYDDIPYAGYLSVDFYIFESDDTSFKEFRIGVGVVGKESGAEFIQREVHGIIGAMDPKGWDTQVGTQYILNALFRYGEKSWQEIDADGIKSDWFNHYGIQVGNFTTDAFMGTMFRTGYNYPSNFNLHYPYLKEEASLLQICKKQTGFGWSLSAGLNGELLAYSYILDEAKNSGYETDKNIINISVYTGMDLYYNRHKITYFYQSQSPYTDQQNEINNFGGLLYSYQF
ncbi:MAG: lipid A deacylase LpxR family protein [Campylobacterota bacterium]|nr:lipid A deacylase LpxR family protein [Campylobacterota bacterium]